MKDTKRSRKEEECTAVVNRKRPEGLKLSELFTPKALNYPNVVAMWVR